MNSDHVKGGFKDIKGRVKEEVGHVTGNTRTEGEGILEQVSGKIQKGIGDLKDAVKDKVDTLLHRDGETGSRKVS